MWLMILAVIIPLITWFGYLKPFSYWKKMSVNQMKPWIIFGDSWPNVLRKMNMPEWLDWIYYMHPNSRYTGMYQFYVPILFLRDTELIKQIAVKDFDHFTDHYSFSISDEVDPLWSKNLFALKGQRWRNMRALLSGSFTSSKMKVMYTLISETSENFTKHFLKQNEDLIEVDITDNLTRYTNDVIASTSFGIKVDSLEHPKNEFYLMGKDASNFTGFTTILTFFGYMLCPRILKFFKVSLFSKRVTHFFNNLINETVKVREEQDIVRQDMINILLEVKKGVKSSEEKEVIDAGFAIVEESSEIVKPRKRQIEITNQDITSQAMIFFLAGFGSVASAMCFACYELALNPDVQDKLRKEIEDTVEECDGNLMYETLLKMQYLDMVISETLRKWPVSPATDRVCVKPYTLQPTTSKESIVSLKKGDTIWIPTFSIHHDSEYYPEPEKFIPERFSDENKHNIKPYTYMPFGVGPRACIGSRFALLEIKSVLFELLKHFEIVPVEKTPIPMKLNKQSFLLLSEKEFLVGFKRLKK